MCNCTTRLGAPSGSTYRHENNAQQLTLNHSAVFKQNVVTPESVYGI